MPPPEMPVPTSIQEGVDATKVEYVQLGSSGLRVSSPILGTMGIGSKEWQDWVMEEEDGIKLLKAAWDRGKKLGPLADPSRTRIYCQILMLGDRRLNLGYGQCLFQRD